MIIQHRRSGGRAWRGFAGIVTVALAVALLASVGLSAGRVLAADVSGSLSSGLNGLAVSTPVASGVQVAKFTETTAVAATSNNQISVQLPAGTTFGSGANVSVNWSATVGGSSITLTGASATGTTLTLSTAAAIGAGAEVIVTTGAAGLITTPPTPTAVGTLIVTTVNGATATAVDTGTLSTLQFIGAPASVSATAPSSLVMATGGSLTVTFTVKDSAGNGVPSASVTFLVSGGTTLSSCTSGSASAGCTATTNSSGEAQITVTSATAGSVTIDAHVGTVTGNATVTVTGAAASITLTNVKYSIATGGSLAGAVSVLVKDSASNPLSGQTVTATANPTTLFSVQPAFAATASDGTATLNAGTCGGTSGSATLTAGIGSVTSNTVTLVCAGTPATVALTLPTGLNTTTNTSGTVTADVTDASGQPVPDGTTVTFAVSPPTRATLSATTGSTSNGQASVTLVATDSGTAAVTATAGSASKIDSLTIGAGGTSGTVALGAGFTFEPWNGPALSGADAIRSYLNDHGLSGAWGALYYPVPATAPIQFQYIFPSGVSVTLNSVSPGQIVLFYMTQAATLTW